MQSNYFIKVSINNVFKTIENRYSKVVCFRNDVKDTL